MGGHGLRALPGRPLAADRCEVKSQPADHIVQKGKRPLGKRCHEISPPLARLHLAHKPCDLLVVLMLRGGRLRLRYALAANKGKPVRFEALSVKSNPGSKQE